jgi:hypothetical protein
VKASPVYPAVFQNGEHDAFSPPFFQNWGYSDKIGLVYLNDREETISMSKHEEIENEVRR